MIRNYKSSQQKLKLLWRVCFSSISPDYPNFVQPRVQGRRSSERILNSNFLVCVISKKGASPQLPPVFCLILFFYFRVHVFSISRTWLSRSKEQATSPEKRASCYKDQIKLEVRRESRSKSWSPCDFHVENSVSTLRCWNKCSLYTDFLYKVFFLFSQLFVVSEHFLDVVSPVQVKDEHSWEKIHTSISYSRYTFLFQFVADPPEGDSDWDLKDNK